jgi:hypothetical protein
VALGIQMPKYSEKQKETIIRLSYGNIALLMNYWILHLVLQVHFGCG